MFELERITADYPSIAPCSIFHTVDLPISPEQTWDLLASTAWPDWFVDFVSVTWFTVPPHGVGSRRQAVLRSASAIERFLIWERGHRLAFGLDAVSLPLVHAMMEDMRLEPLANGGTRLNYHVFYTPNALMKLLHPAVRAYYNRLFGRSLANLQAYVAGP